MLLVGKISLIADEVATSPLELKILGIQVNFSHNGQAFVIHSKPHHGKSKSGGRNHLGRDNWSQMHFLRDMDCYYCHKKGLVRGFYEDLTKHLEVRKNLEAKKC